jgi:hypothetical protein
MPFVSFISYARVNKSSQVEKFVKRLSEQIRDKTGCAPAEIAFFDTSSIATGQDWARVLGDALLTSKVIICLCTPHYLNSQFCGKELQIFLLRRQAWLQKPENASRKAGIVFPVIWELPVGGLPKSLGAFQFADSGFPRKYVDNGLNALALIGREKDNFMTVVIKLAQRIREAIKETDLPTWPALPAFDDIPSIFHADASELSHQYGVVFLHGKGRDWSPFGSAAADLLDVVTAQTNRLCREIPVDAGLVASLAAANNRRESVVILTDIDTLDDPAQAKLLAELDAASLPNCAIVLLSGSQNLDASAIERARAMLPSIAASNRPNSWGTVRTQPMLIAEVVRTLERLAPGLVRNDPAEKFDDLQMRADALALGRDLDVAPSIAGPGGSR